METLESFHHHVARSITWRFVRQSTRDDGTTYWTYPSNVESLDLAGLKPIGEYILQRRNEILRYATTDSPFYPIASTLRRTTWNYWWAQNNYFNKTHVNT